MNGSAVRLLVPVGDVADPELSIVIPALNEAVTIGRFVDWCQEGLRRANVKGEIVIIDSSSDATPRSRLREGPACSRRPISAGRAYIDALPFVRGDYVLMGDADCTYDFAIWPRSPRSFAPATSIMGSRFRGYIEPGSMPPLHRYSERP